MKIGSGGYGDVYHPPRYPPKYAGNKAYIQRYTDETKTQIYNGEKARKIFDPKNLLSVPIRAIYPRKGDFFSEIMPYKKGDLMSLLKKYYYRNPKLFDQSLILMSRIMIGMERLHKKKWVHRDIKLTNFLYDMKPLRYFLIDWATTLPSCRVYEEDASNWHTANNENLPPEYKSYAYFQHGFRFDDFAREYAKNPSIHILTAIQPAYMSMLNKAHKKIQTRLHSAKNPHALMDSLATKVDVYAMGLVLSQMLEIWGDRESPLTPKILRMLRGMIDPDPFRRLDMEHANRQMQSILKKKKTLS